MFHILRCSFLSNLTGILFDISVDLENMPEDAEPDPHVGMRPSLSPGPSPAKGPLSSSEGPTANGASEDRPPRMNGAPEEEKIQEYLQRTDTAVIFPEPVGGNSPNKTEEKAPPTPEPAPVIGKLCLLFTAVLFKLCAVEKFQNM